MNIKPQISPMITDEEKNLGPSVESVVIFEGVVHGASEPHRGDEKSASVAGHRSSVVYFRRRILAFSAPLR
ncbi:MAG: hypothetical protein D6723_11465 [Acidobacteria bacterium]|nr:MAG: hypothetical protein D6723_11465 [Acidobacteriota bacterium]